MTDDQLRQFRKRISRQRDDLLKLIDSESGDTASLEGATVQDVLKVVAEIREALDRIDSGDFGQCNLCTGEVEIERLEQDFTTTVCLAHYSDDELRQLERDLELTAQIQKQLLPAYPPGNTDLKIAHMNKPAGIVGGDYYDFFEIADGVQGIVIADVMGKGIPASILMSNLQATLRILGPEYRSLDALMTRLNHLFCYNMKLIHFISMCLVGIDVRQGVVHYCNAGHHPPVLWKSRSQSLHWLSPTGPAIGLMKDAIYESNSAAFEANDLLVLYTDGLVEARNGNYEEFGDDRLGKYVSNHHHQSVEMFLTGLRAEAESFARNFQDDLTLLAIKI